MVSQFEMHTPPRVCEDAGVLEFPSTETDSLKILCVSCVRNSPSFFNSHFSEY